MSTILYNTLVDEGRIQEHIALSREDNARWRFETRSRVSARDRGKRVDDFKFGIHRIAVSNIARGRKLNFLAGVDRSITKFAYANPLSFSPCRRTESAACSSSSSSSTLLALLCLLLYDRRGMCLTLNDCCARPT